MTKTIYTDAQLNQINENVKRDSEENQVHEQNLESDSEESNSTLDTQKKNPWK